MSHQLFDLSSCGALRTSNVSESCDLRGLRHCLASGLGLTLISLPWSASFRSMFNSIIHTCYVVTGRESGPRSAPSDPNDRGSHKNAPAMAYNDNIFRKIFFNSRWRESVKDLPCNRICPCLHLCRLTSVRSFLEKNASSQSCRFLRTMTVGIQHPIMQGCGRLLRN